MPAFVTASSGTTPVAADASTVAVTIFPTVAGNDLFVVINAGDDPGAVPSPVVSSIAAAGASFAYVPDSAIYASTGTRTAAVAIYRAKNVPAGITTVTVTFATSRCYGVEVGEYSTVRSVGHVDTTSGTAVPVSIALPTQDTNNIVLAGFAAESTAGPFFTGATVGNARELVYVFGSGSPDIPGALLDNTSAAPASVTNTVTTTGQSLWAAAAVELRSTIGAGFRSFQSLWFGPDGSAGVGAPMGVTGGFRSFQSFWFGPDAGGAAGAVTPTRTARKLISPHFAATLHGELT